MSYLKLDEALLTSTLWLDRVARDVFIVAGLKARPTLFTEPIEVYAPSSTGPSIYTLPPGEYGFTEASGPGLVALAGHNPKDPIDWAAGMDALRRLTEPDAASRNPALEGRRLARINGGYLVLNLIQYRGKDHTAAERKRRQRERDRDICDMSRPVTEDRRQSTEEQTTDTPLPPKGGAADVFAHWQSVMAHPSAKFTPGRKRAVLARFRDGYTLEQLRQAIDGCKASAYHQGANKDGTVYDDLTLICRSGEHVERFIGYLNPPSTAIVKAQPTQRAQAFPTRTERNVAEAERAIRMVKGGAR